MITTFNIFFSIIVFFFGSIIGSFLNVVILRYNTGMSFVKGRSICFSCGKKLTWYELIPVVSYLIQAGRCRGCKSRISPQYPLVEALTGSLFVGVFMLFGGFIPFFSIIPDFYTIGLMVIGFMTVSVLVTISVYDIKHKIIPTALSVIFSVLSLINLFYYYFFTNDLAQNLHTHLVWYLLAGPVLASPLFLIWLISRGKWMGLGDPKLVLSIGWFLGPILGLSALILAFWSGAIYGIIMLILSKMKWHGLQITGKTEVPFAPFLILGFLAVYFFGFDVLGLAVLIP